MVQKQKLEHKIMIKKIEIRAGIALAVLLILYLWIFGIFSNINNFWKNFRGGASNTSSDILSPLPPYLKRIPLYTNKDSVEISGSSENGARIQFFLNDQGIMDTIADKDGSFNFGLVKIQPSKNTIYSVATDEAGNKSVDSEKLTITFDNKKPKIDVTEPRKGDTYTSKVRSFTVVGKTDPGSKVLVNEQIAQMKEDGNFTCQIYPNEGSNKVTVEATDLAGNVDKQEIFFTFNEE